MEALCLSLGAQYSPVVGSTSRHLGAAGAGQAVQSKHKVGMALDLEANIPEPTKTVPFAYEADWVKKGSTFRPRWLLYIHSSLDPKAAVATDALAAVPATVKTRIVEHLGPDLPADAVAFLAELQTFVDDLLARIAAPSLLRDWIRRPSDGTALVGASSADAIEYARDRSSGRGASKKNR